MPSFSRSKAVHWAGLDFLLGSFAPPARSTPLGQTTLIEVNFLFVCLLVGCFWLCIISVDVAADIRGCTSV